MSRKPPTELERLLLFVDLAEHYFEACDELPLDTNVEISFSEKVPLAHEVRLMLLRKFVEQEQGKDGNVHLRRVAQPLASAIQATPFVRTESCAVRCRGGLCLGRHDRNSGKRATRRQSRTALRRSLRTIDARRLGAVKDE